MVTAGCLFLRNMFLGDCPMARRLFDADYKMAD